MIEISNVTFSYPSSPFRLAIDALLVADGEKLAIVGPSGTGKTTLLNLMARILVPQSGSVSVNGIDVAQLTDSQRRDFRAARLGMVFQQFELLDYLTVVDNVRLPYLINRTLYDQSHGRDFSAAAVYQRANDLLDSVGLSGFAKRYPAKLSRGEQQRVAICRALITQPEVILADEPTGNLDPANKQKILELLFAQANERNRTLVLVTHDHSILNGFDRVVDFETFLTTNDSALAAGGVA